MQDFRLTPPALDFYVDVHLRPYEGGTWVAKADLASEQDTGMDRDPRKAIEKALESLGWRYAREMAESAEFYDQRSGDPVCPEVGDTPQEAV